MRICICNVPHNWGEIFSDTAIDADSRLFQASASKILKYEQLKFSINVNNKKWWGSFLHISLGLNSPPGSCGK